MKKGMLAVIAMCMACCFTGCNGTTAEGDVTATPVPTQKDLLFSDVEAPGTKTIELSKEKLKGLCESLEKKTWQTELYTALNTKISLDMERNKIFCVDEATGAAYFVHTGKDYYVYRIKEGTAELAVGLPAKELCIWDGIVYFMLDSHGIYELSGGNTGDIYAYTPADGEVKPVYAASGLLGTMNQRLHVNEAGVYFSAGVMEAKTVGDKVYQIFEENYYYLPFGQTEPQEDANKTTKEGWGKYYLANDHEKKYILHDRQDNSVTSEKLELGADGIVRCQFMGDKLYFTTELTVGVKDMITGEMELYDFQPVADTEVHMGEQQITIGDFAILGNYVWATYGGTFLLKMDKQTKEITRYYMGRQLNELYTDGEFLYALAVGTSEDTLVRIKTEQEIETGLELWMELEVEFVVK